MKALAYYNEHDRKAAAWLRELIAEGHIAPGEVDERSILDVRPHELTRFTQQHFFAGIGGWPLAFRLSGVPDDEPWWSGSCPCQPFSLCGKQEGFEDARDLWPAWFGLIRERRPGRIFGEQVDDSAEWIERTAVDLESLGYAFAPVTLPALAVSAKQERGRVFFVADATSQHGRSHDSLGAGGTGRAPQQPRRLPSLHVAGQWWQEGAGAERLPTLVRQFLMGYPRYWVDSAMRSFRNSPQNLSKRVKKL